jgi:hypothetical protein
MIEVVIIEAGVVKVGSDAVAGLRNRRHTVEAFLFPAEIEQPADGGRVQCLSLDSRLAELAEALAHLLG